MAWTRFYQIYIWIKVRCKSKKWKRHELYSWRWIKCLWNSFEEFRNDMYEPYLEHVKIFWESQTTIDRINNDWDYCKENCRRATQKEQRNNTRSLTWKQKYWLSKDEVANKYWYTKSSIRIFYKRFNLDFYRMIERLDNHKRFIPNRYEWLTVRQRANKLWIKYDTMDSYIRTHKCSLCDAIEFYKNKKETELYRWLSVFQRAKKLWYNRNTIYKYKKKNNCSLEDAVNHYLF